LQINLRWMDFCVAIPGRSAGHCMGFPSCPNVMAIGREGCERIRYATVGDCGWRCGNRANQLADQAIKFCVCDHVRGLLAPQRSAKYTRQAEHRLASTCQAIGRVVLADQLTPDAENRCLQGEEINVLQLDPTHMTEPPPIEEGEN